MVVNFFSIILVLQKTIIEFDYFLSFCHWWTKPTIFLLIQSYVCQIVKTEGSFKKEGPTCNL